MSAVGTGATALLLQLAFEPPGPSIVAIKLVLALVAHVPVPVQLFALQLPEAAGETDGCLVESISIGDTRLIEYYLTISRKKLCVDFMSARKG